jgi:glyoxylase-like metal-dependent hydrolase (beta-lactamase superfamily II)
VVRTYQQFIQWLLNGDVFRRGCYALLMVDVILLAAHMFLPEYEWGQSRDSYFKLDNQLTFASWLTAMKLGGVAILCLFAFHRESVDARAAGQARPWMWFGCAGAALLWSFCEITRIHVRLELLDYQNPDIYAAFVHIGMGIAALATVAAFLLRRIRNWRSPTFVFAVLWIFAWTVAIGASAITRTVDIENIGNWTILRGLCYLAGTTLMLLTVGTIALRRPGSASAAATAPVEAAVGDASADTFPTGRRSIWLLIGVGGTTFTIIYLQIILFQMLMIFADFLTAQLVISIALLGLAVGGLIGAKCAPRAPIVAMVTAALVLPFGIMLAFGTTVRFMDTPLVASLLITVPFACGSAVITVALSRARSHLVYFIDLVGAAIGAFAVCAALSVFREESSLLFLSAFTALLVSCYAIYLRSAVGRAATLGLSAVLCITFIVCGSLNLKNDSLNIIRHKVLKSHKNATVMYSRSSFVGRYDIVKRSPRSSTLKGYNNGRTIDTMRPNQPEQFQIDPRLPHTYMDNPSILIVGLSGDGVSKTARFLSDRVVGIEINPRIVELQANELIPYNGNSYKDIEVHVMDGRSYLEETQEKFDIVTLMNAHGARGQAAGSAPSPEYLFTLEAFESYFEHMTDNGILNIEEPINRPRREPPVWKMLVTIRQALLNIGYTNPEKHCFVFQWRTRTNNYIQTVVKKTPLTAADNTNLQRWLDDVDRVRQIEAAQQRKLGPIRTKTTILHMPDAGYDTYYSRLLAGQVSDDVLDARNLTVTTDNQPFHFDVDPGHPNIKKAYVRALLMSLLLLPFFIAFLGSHRRELRRLLPFVLAVMLTGLGYFLIEVVLIERYEIFIGAPVVTFSTILGTLLIFSGLGSLWSGRATPARAYLALAAVFLMLVSQQFMPNLFHLGAALPLGVKVLLVVVAVAPLAFCMGVPFPFVLRLGKDRYDESSAGVLFAFNSVASALAVPLAMNISTSFGLNTTFGAGIIIYLVIVLLLASMHVPALQIPANIIAIGTAIVMFAGPWITGRTVVGEADDRYKVYAISYGQSRYRSDKIFLNGQREQQLRFEWMFWVIRNGARTIVVDTGFDDSIKAQEWGIDNYINPVERLKDFGIDPAGVTDVVLTHMHWDHCGALQHYPNANIWLQSAEFEHAKTILSENDRSGKGMQWAHLQNVLAAQAKGKLQLVEGDNTPFPGVELHLGGSHTPGSQYLRVETTDGPVVLAGDNTYMYQNNRWHIPIGTCVDHDDNIEAVSKMHRIAATPYLIIPGHDPRVMNWFPEVAEGIVQITMIEEKNE